MNQEQIDQLFDQEQIYRFFITNVESITFDEKEMVKVCKQERHKVKRLELSISTEGMRYFSNIKWKNLSTISFISSQFGNTSCKYLSRANLKSIQNIYLDWNQIGDEGVMHLSKGQWPTLSLISIMYNYFKLTCIKMLLRANWKRLQNIDGRYNPVRKEEIVQFALMEAPSIQSIQLQSKSGGRQTKTVSSLKNKFKFRIQY